MPRETILIVDDQDDVVELAKCLLAAEGYSVIDGCSGDDALYLSVRYPLPIHLLLTDVRMGPGLDGFALADAMRGARPGMRVIYMTGFTDDPRLQDEVAGGSAGFLPKPFTRKTLLRCVAEALSLRAA